MNHFASVEKSDKSETKKMEHLDWRAMGEVQQFKGGAASGCGRGDHGGGAGVLEMPKEEGWQRPEKVAHERRSSCRRTVVW